MHVCSWPLVSMPWPNHEAVGFQPKAVVITDLGSCKSPIYILKPPLRRICIPVTRKNERSTDNWTSIGHQCEQLALRGFPINISSYVLQLFHFLYNIPQVKISLFISYSFYRYNLSRFFFNNLFQTNILYHYIWKFIDILEPSFMLLLL